MKVNSLIAKTALAAAIAGASFAASAGTVSVANPAVLAIELFGDAGGVNGTLAGLDESNQTAITLPTVTFTPGLGELASKVNADGDIVTVKLTLAETAAVWAESYDDPTIWATQNIEIALGGASQNAKVVGVDAGTVGNKTITIHIAALATDDLTQPWTLKGFKINRLKATHMNEDGETQVNVEVRNTDTDGAGTQEYASGDNAVAIYSTKGVILDGTKTSYEHGDEATRGYIQVGDAQQSFTDWTNGYTNATTATGNDHRNDFENKAAELYLGELKITRGKKTVTPVGGVATDIPASKEGGVGGTLAPFDISGGDRIELSITGDASLLEYGLTLNTKPVAPATQPCGASTTATPATPVLGNPNKVTITLPGAGVNLDGTAAWDLCANATAVGTERIQQLSSLKADLKVKYTNTTYGISSGTYDYGEVLRNGCQVTLFNLPNVNAGDKAMIRLTNTSDKAGQVNAFVYLEDGSRIDNDALLADNIPAHGTTTFSTNPNAGVYLGDKLPTFALEDKGRARIVIQGAFPSCEALGLIRSPNGTLTNMTSTTNSSGTTAGTSNTSN